MLGTGPSAKHSPVRKDPVVFVHFGSLGWQVRVRGGGEEKEGWRKKKEGRGKKIIGFVEHWWTTACPGWRQILSSVWGLFRCCWRCAVWLSVLRRFERRDTSTVPAFLKAEFTSASSHFWELCPSSFSISNMKLAQLSPLQHNKAKTSCHQQKLFWHPAQQQDEAHPGADFMTSHPGLDCHAVFQP